MVRESLPSRRRNLTVKATIGGTRVYLTYARFADGRIAEVFAKANKMTTAANGLMQALGIVFSIALQYGVPLEVLCSALRGIAFEPDGEVMHNPHVLKATSIVDYMVRALEAEANPPPPKPKKGRVRS